MSNAGPKILKQFRSKFNLPDKNVLRWFPGHMGSGMKKMQQKIKSVDIVVEIHDARIPISGRNPNFKNNILGIKPHLLVLNKSDLADRRYDEKIRKYFLLREGISNVIFTDCKNPNSTEIKSFVPNLAEIVRSSDRFNRSENKEFSVMIIGVPNVGKSSLINVLRTTFLKKEGVAHVGAKAGITRAVQNRIKVCKQPPVFVYDTPGILSPNISDVEVGLKLALCATIEDHRIGSSTLADFLLFWMNKNGIHSYMDFFDIDEPCDHMNYLLATKAIKNQCYFIASLPDGRKVNIPNIELIAFNFLDAFRRGLFGNITLDSDIIGT